MAKTMMNAEDYNIADILRNVNNPAADHSNVQSDIISYNVATIAIVATTILVRTSVRAFIVKHVAIEDYLMLAAGGSAIALCAMVLVGVSHGLGKNIWDISLATIIEDVQLCIQQLFVCQCLHALSLTLVKLSIISTYWRVFPSKTMRRTLLVLATLITAVAISTLFGTIFQCTPIAGAWNFNLQRKCYRVEYVLYYSTAFSAFSDILVCLLPLPFFWKLSIPHKEKVIVSCLFGLGLFAAAASIFRITTLSRLRNINATRAAIPTLDWSIAEVLVGIVCACLPCLKPLLNKLVPGEFFTISLRRRTGRTTATSEVGAADRLGPRIKVIRPPSPPALAHLSSSGSGHWRGRGDSWYGKQDFETRQIATLPPYVARADREPLEPIEEEKMGRDGEKPCQSWYNGIPSPV